MTKGAPVRIGILSREKDAESNRRLVEAFTSRGHDARVLNTMRLSIELVPGAPTLAYRGKPLPRIDGVVPRIGVSATFHGAAVLAQLRLMGIYSPVSARGLRCSRDKLQALQVFAETSIPYPPTAFVCRRSDLGPALDRLGEPPYVVKVLQGTQGSGVLLAPDRHEAINLAETLLDADRPVLLQRFIAESRGRDVRAVVVGDSVVSAVRRVNDTGEFRSNVHRGAKPEKIAIEPAFAETAIRAASALGLEVAGVDMLEGADGPVVLEVNSSPGIHGMEDATGDDIAGAIAEHVATRASE
ncbi:MAG: RimK family alpha-L-glutamate ligase [Deltaproteobacteria bacterium]|nr:RimK family alpha-L-glutamate ligase [Deltaproteobacteria bacterium]